MSLPAIKIGDRVRITLEGVVKDDGAGVYSVILDGGGRGETNFCDFELTAPTARVEVLAPAIDPDLVLAREWFKARHGKHTTSVVDDGGWDTSDSIQGYLAGLRAAKGVRS